MADNVTKGNDPVFLLRQDAQDILEMLRTPDPDIPFGMGSSPLVLAMTPSGGIAARSGTTVSSASCNFYKISGSTVSTATGTITVYNLSTTAVAGSKYIIAARAGGVHIAVWEDC